MDAISYDQFLQSPVKLKPAPVQVAGIDQPLLVHQFTMDEIQLLNQKTSLENDATEFEKENSLRKQVLFFLRGLNADPTDDDCQKLSEVFSGWQLRDIYKKAMKLNGFGPDSLREAEKN